MNTYEKVKEWRAKNKDKVNEQARRYRAKHPEANKKAKAKYRENNLEIIRERDRVAQAKKRKNDPDAQKVRNEHFAIRKEAKRWEIAGRQRAEICELCNKNELTVFDHCHISGKFRGWICDRCNKVLGIVKDSKELLLNMIKYLERHDVEVNNEAKEQFV